MPKLEVTPANGKKVAIVGSGAAGLAAALVLAQLGYVVDLLDRQAKSGGAVRYIPAHRMDPQVLDTDIAKLDRRAAAKFRGEHIGFVFQDHCLLLSDDAQQTGRRGRRGRRFRGNPKALAEVGQ